jgi:anti-sigma regulatory factor (Ser/Thr protein kinase)
MRLSQSIALSDSTSAAEARRLSVRMAESLGLNETKSGEAAIIVMEAARNAVIYGGGGELVLCGQKNKDEARIDILALDRGPGIPDLPRALTDGYSTGSTPGTGLGAIRRMAASFDLFSTAMGTALFARVAQPASVPTGKSTLEVAGISVPLAGERVCGDNLAWSCSSDRLAVLAVDGLGHGPGAADAADEAVRIFHAHAQQPPGEVMSRLHDALKKTRGAAAAMAELRPLAGTLVYAGVGNISGVIISDSLGRNLVSHNGTLGHIMSRNQEFKVEWPRDGILIMHSDGLQSRWDLSRYPGLLARQPALIAGVLFRDFRRQRDDASVLVVKAAR